MTRGKGLLTRYSVCVSWAGRTEVQPQKKGCCVRLCVSAGTKPSITLLSFVREQVYVSSLFSGPLPQPNWSPSKIWSISLLSARSVTPLQGPGHSRNNFHCYVSGCGRMQLAGGKKAWDWRRKSPVRGSRAGCCFLPTPSRVNGRIWSSGGNGVQLVLQENKLD